MKEIYRSPGMEWCCVEAVYIFATSPTGEDFTEPEDYGGF
jgi:hypothetical protein